MYQKRSANMGQYQTDNIKKQKNNKNIRKYQKQSEKIRIFQKKSDKNQKKIRIEKLCFP